MWDLENLSNFMACKIFEDKWTFSSNHIKKWASIYPKNLTLKITNRNWIPMSFNSKPQIKNLDTTIILPIYFLLSWMRSPLNVFIFNFPWTFQWCGSFKDLINLGTRLLMMPWLGMHSRLWGLITHLIAKQFKFINFQGVLLTFIYNLN